MSSTRIFQNAASASMRLTAKRTFVTLPLAARSTSLALNKHALFASPSLLSSYNNSINNNKRFLNNKAENEIFKVVDFNDIQTLIKKEGKGYELIDVREEKEVVQGTIPTAKNVPLSQFAGWTLSDNEFKAQFGFEKPKKEDLVILYCLGGVRSTKAAEYLYSLGYENLENYIGSWADYVEQIKKQQA